jgi:hypothetical protein
MRRSNLPRAWRRAGPCSSAKRRPRARSSACASSAARSGWIGSSTATLPSASRPPPRAPAQPWPRPPPPPPRPFARRIWLGPSPCRCKLHLASARCGGPWGGTPLPMSVSASLPPLSFCFVLRRRIEFGRRHGGRQGGEREKVLVRGRSGRVGPLRRWAPCISFSLFRPVG